MGRVMGCGLCPYNAIEKVGNYALCLANDTALPLTISLLVISDLLPK